MNAVAQRCFTTSNDIACGKFYADVLHVYVVGSDSRVELFAINGVVNEFEGVVYSVESGEKKYFSYKVREISLEDGGGEGWMFVFADATASEELARQEWLRQRMEALENLYISIAQEISNTLGSITGFAEILSEKLDKDPSFSKLSHMLTSSVHKATDLGRKLLKFPLSAQPVLELLDICRLLREVICVLPPKQQERIRIRNKADTETTVNVDRVAVETVLLGIILHMQSVLEREGILAVGIEIADNTCSSLEVKDYELEAKQYIKLVFAGKSSEDVQELHSRIFKSDNLFMSDTGVAEEDGLFGIVKNLQGALEVTSGIDKELRVEFYLPFLREDSTMGDARGEDLLLSDFGLELPEEKKVVLLVDDNELVRFPVREMLVAMNCEVLEAGDGEEALALFRENHRRIDLVILDVIMPVKGGRETLLELRGIDDTVEVAMASGYMNQLPEDYFSELGVNFCLSKPYRIAEIRSIVHSLYADKLRRGGDGSQLRTDLEYLREIPQSEYEEISLMLVESNESVRELLYEVLSEAKFVVSVFEDIAQAKAAVTEGRYFAVAIIDIDFINDYDDELFLLLKKNNDSPVYIIASSSKGMEQVAFRTLKWGMDDFIQKPFSLNFIRIRLEVARRYIETEQLKNKMQSLLKESEERMSLAIDSVGIGMWDWKIIEKEFYASDKCKAIFGYPSDSDQRVLDYLYAVTVKEDQAILTRDFSGYLRNPQKILNTEFRIVHPQKGEVWIQAIGKLFDDSKKGKPKRLIGIAMDITERKNEENILREESQKLEELVMRRTAELTEINEQLSREIEAREEAELKNLEQQLKLMDADKLASLGILVSGIGHEINNPVQFIMFNMPFIKNVWKSTLPILDQYYALHPDFQLRGVPYSMVKDRVLTMSEDVIEGAERISSIVKDLREYSRKSRKEEFKSEDIIEVILSAKSLFLKFYGRREIDIILHAPSEPIVIYINKSRIEQVIINLLHNAALALEDATDKRIEVNARYCKDGDAIEITVSDKGVGIRPEYLKHLTDPFFTTRSSDGGSGLGLAMCNKIVHDHGGDLVFESEFGAGTTVKIFLPVKSRKLD